MYNHLVLTEILSQTGDGDESELLKAKEEAKELRVHNGILTRRGQHQHEEIKRLNKVRHEKQKQLTSTQTVQLFTPCNNCFNVFAQALDDTLQTTQPLDCSETLQDLWKHQVRIVDHHICTNSNFWKIPLLTDLLRIR